MAPTYWIRRRLHSSMVVNHIFSFNATKVITQNLEKNAFCFTSTRQLFGGGEWEDVRHFRELDSMPFDENDEEMLLQMTEGIDHVGGGYSSEQTKASQSEYNSTESVQTTIIINYTSIMVGTQIFQFPSPILNSNILRSPDNRSDLLVICLKNLQLLLVKVLLQSNGKFELNILTRIYLEEPEVLQNSNRLELLGHHVACSSDGKVIAITGMINKVRFLNLYPSPRTINCFIEGPILHQCFLEPFAPEYLPTHVMYLILSQNVDKILTISLLEFDQLRLTDNFTLHRPLLLPREFPLPKFVIPMKRTHGVLLCAEGLLCFKGINSILSQTGLDDVTIYLAVFNPICYFVLDRPIASKNSQNKFLDQVIINDAIGNLWLVESYRHDKLTWNLECDKVCTFFPMSSFVLQPRKPSSFKILYAKDFGDISEGLLDLDSNNKYSITKSKTKILNTIPLLDYQLVPSPNGILQRTSSSQQLWCVGGTTSMKSHPAIWNIHRGISARIVNPSLPFKYANRLYYYGTVDDAIYFIISFPRHSQLHCLNVTSAVTLIEDFTVDSKTILFESIGSDCDYILVTENFVRIGNFLDLDSSLQVELPEKTLLASFKGGYLVLSSSIKSETNLMIYKLNLKDFRFKSTEEILKPIPLNTLQDIEPSLLKLFFHLNEIFLLVGTFDNVLCLYKLKNGCFQIIGIVPLDSVNGFRVPHECMKIHDKDEPEFLITSQNGHYLICSLHIAVSSVTLKVLRSVQIGDTYVQISHAGSSSYYLTCRVIWKLNLSQSMYPEKVFIGDKMDKGIYSTISLAKNEYKAWENLLVARNDRLLFLEVDTFSSSIVSKFKLCNPPLKMAYMEHMSSFVIISAELTQRISVFNLKSRRELPMIIPSEVFEAEETPSCLCQWEFEREFRKYVHLIVGTKNGTHGSIKLLAVSQSNELITATEIYSWDAPSQILSVVTLNDCSILFSSGKTLYFTYYDESKRKLATPTLVYSGTSDIITLSTNDNMIIATTFSSSFKILYYSPTNRSFTQGPCDKMSQNLIGKCLYFQNLRPHINGTTTASNSEQVIADEGSIIVSDKINCKLFEVMKTTSWDTTDNVLFEDCLPIVSRLSQSSLRSMWYEKSQEQNSDQFLAGGVNGEFYIYERVKKTHFNYLRSHLGNCKRLLLEKYSTALIDCPFEFSLPALFDTKERNVVDGDFLDRQDPFVDYLLSRHTL
ncbi:BA75_04434T0 [Komagataella pastoris]|uniref:BA75_04434T0 n=1 Tax=Komagataella pastoris TaxID=4922 RepID=A0A1B2JIC8_PICPA|nr:BA75_04434T0 [Komagataella pastoris]